MNVFRVVVFIATLYGFAESSIHMEPAAPSGTYQVYLIIAVGMFALLLLGGAIILFVLYYQKRMVQEKLQRQVMEIDFQKRMIEAALESQENERRRVAGDLHDSIGAMLSTIRLSFLTFARQHNGAQESVTENKKLIDETIESVRRISRDLMPSTLEKFGLSQAVKDMCERFQSSTQLAISFTESGEPRSLGKKQDLMVFRIIQELINNALKHANASAIQVNFINDDSFTATVEDNGVGFDVEAHKLDKTSGKGLGLFNIENRARLAGADIQFSSEKGRGTKTTLTMLYEKI
jgi:two-component system, NarL family, sensor kinase